MKSFSYSFIVDCTSEILSLVEELHLILWKPKRILPPSGLEDVVLFACVCYYSHFRCEWCLTHVFFPHSQLDPS